MKKRTIGLAGMIMAGILLGGCGDTQIEDENISTVATEQETQEVKVSEAVETEELLEITEATEELENDVFYTTVDTDKDSLIKLVKNTILLSNEQINYNLKEDNELVDIVFSPAVNAFREAKKGSFDLNQTFDYGENGNPFSEIDSNTDNWTYLDMAGMIGYFVFFNEESNIKLENMSITTDKYLKNFFANDFFDADTEKFSDWGISEENYVFSNNNSSIDLTIKFNVDFNYENEEYTAMICSINDGYRVVDIVKSSELINNKEENNSTNNNTNVNNETDTNNTNTDTTDTSTNTDNIVDNSDTNVNDVSDNNTNDTTDDASTDTSIDGDDERPQWMIDAGIEINTDPSTAPVGDGSASNGPSGEINPNCY